jgi:hypothetical protein
MRAFTFKDTLAGAVLAGLIGAGSNAPALAQQQRSAAPPDFSSNHVGWSGFNPTGPFLAYPVKTYARYMLGAPSRRNKARHRSVPLHHRRCRATSGKR